MLLLDLDAAQMSDGGGGGAAELRRLAESTPMLVRLGAEMQAYADKAEPDPDERRLQAALLAFMRELLSVAPQQALVASAAAGEAADSARNDAFGVVEALAQDALRATSDLPNADAVSKRLLMCRADAWSDAATRGRARRPPHSWGAPTSAARCASSC